MLHTVDRCVCFSTTFQRWLELVRARGWSLDEAARHTMCGEGCGMCRQHLRIVYYTGRTRLPLLIPEELEHEAALRAGADHS